MKNHLQRLIPLLLASFLSFTLFGCAASPIDFSEGASLAANEGVAFGRVKLLVGGKEKSLSSIFGESIFRLILLPAETSQAISVPLKEDGTFIWHLPEGNYTIASYEWRSSSTISGRIFAKYAVSPNRSTYIGTLAITIAGTRYLVEIVDDFETTLPSVQQKIPLPGNQPTKNLMTMEPRR